MKCFLLRRFFTSIVILFGISLVLYGIIRLLPSDYVQTITTQNPQITIQAKHNLRDLYGLDASLLAGYIHWITQAARGNFGISFIYKKPVVQVIHDKMWISFALTFLALIAQILIAIPLGIVSAVKKNSKTDRLLNIATFLGISMPVFFFAALLQKVFALDLHWFPLQGMINARSAHQGMAKILDIAHHLFLPILVLACTSAGSLLRHTRSTMLEVLNAEYINTARSKGLSEKTVLYRHVLKNSLIPLITLFGSTIPSLFSAVLIIEQIFAIDGLGRTAFTAIKMGDIPFIMGFNVFLVFFSLAGILIADIMHILAAPRVKLQ